MYILHNAPEWRCNAQEILLHVVCMETSLCQKAVWWYCGQHPLWFSGGIGLPRRFKWPARRAFSCSLTAPFSSELNAVFRGITLLFRGKSPECQASLWHPGLVWPLGSHRSSNGPYGAADHRLTPASRNNKSATDSVRRRDPEKRAMMGAAGASGALGRTGSGQNLCTLRNFLFYQRLGKAASRHSSRRPRSARDR